MEPLMLHINKFLSDYALTTLLIHSSFSNEAENSKKVVLSQG